MSYANGRLLDYDNGESYNSIPVPIIQEIPLALLLRATSVAGCCRSVIARFQWK
jgi:hypothetical protein